MQIPALSTVLVLAASTLAAAGAVGISSPTEGANVLVGLPLTVTWEPSSPGTKVSLFLAGGPDPGHLQSCGAIVEHIDNVGSMQWDVATTKPDGTAWECDAWWNPGSVYGIKIVTETDSLPHWSSHFNIPH